jgi:hypothetical protein
MGKVIVILVLALPIAVVGTFMLGPLWSWVEATYGIESVGHAMYAGWCFVATYAVLAFLGLLMLSLAKSKTASP